MPAAEMPSEAAASSADAPASIADQQDREKDGTKKEESAGAADGAATATDTDGTVKVQVGSTYLCTRFSGEDSVVHPATVIQARTSLAGEDEYYVHFAELDRRLDTWVARDRLGERVILPAPRSDRKRRDRDSSSNLGVGAHVEADDASHRKRTRSDQLHEVTKVRNINRVQLGKHEIDCWYYSPYPEDFGKCDKLYICETTFKYFATRASFEAYQASRAGEEQRPPGEMIYRDPSRSICVYEIEGSREELFGENLCLFGKLFIEHKTLSFDPTPFFFYVLYEEDDEGLHPVGYFSKEKDSKENYNLACIVTLPPFQRKGYGKFIISLSYEVTKRRKEVGSPEKPLSDLGKLSYRTYWTYVLLEHLVALSDQDLNQLTLEALSLATGIKPEDILSTMQSLSLIYHLKGQYVIRIERAQIQDLLAPYKKRKFASSFCKPELLHLKDFSQTSAAPPSSSTPTQSDDAETTAPAPS
ncbi:Histone acetyltransferase [Hondaea fermentalgiana]|uniref:histone acetyltransferase n=1 Tax=Hondaea fermentalgiana TaxID=2315210 RepID=A0A2R5GKS0_9STRA|nr:Histone acetyltransferase [Hondaea fermentalgiana]|eukprot:GBG30909.1 Histone acetyltransferase [Hondaea fermentalgiana]